MTPQEAIDKFLDYYAARSRRSAVSYRIGLNHYVEWLGDSTGEAGELTTAQARDFAVWLANDYRTQEGRRLGKSSLMLYLTSLLKFYDFLIVNGIIDGDNFIKTSEWIRRLIRGKEQSPIEKKLPPPEAVTTLLDAVDVEPDIPDNTDRDRRRLVWLRNRAIVYCLESSGVRVGELVSIRCGDLVRKDRGAWVKGKGEKERFARFSPQAWQRIDDYLRMRGNTGPQIPLFCRHDRGAGDKSLPLSTLTVERTITRLARNTGILDTFHLTPHSLRHYFATRFLRHTGNLALTQDVLGHANPQTTRIYAKTSKEQIIQAHEEIFD